MTDSIQPIIRKARELASSIREHEITLRYNETLARISNDRQAQQLYARLIAMGKELNDRLSAGGAVERQESSEYEMMQKELEQNTLVKEYIQNQKEYLNLLNRVIEKIKNPS
ncbi:MAG TPA: YlbF family regulator [Spirochaetota bacterium]|nr:YlbF family regulator [Spirochaetota bacterium]HPV41404.1 YlbF family regulator [Spirochaetota bacterium]